MNKNKRVLKNKSNSKNKIKVNRTNVSKLQENVKKQLANKKGVRVKNTPCGVSIKNGNKLTKLIASNKQDRGSYSTTHDKHGVVTFVNEVDATIPYMTNEVLNRSLKESNKIKNTTRTRK